MTTYYNYATRDTIEVDDRKLDDRTAMQLIPQDKISQDIYVYARKLGCDIREAMSRALLSKAER